ncbi:aminotransferase class IV [Microbispora sp. H11081]|uniref:aminotransferase class IV n=1 Tax=Microbispora sp. H11081 TaxID=2729107 RepID=UPI001475F4CB|nr:aminotransferase class IV [Microbispora sp. H11081]
MAFSSAPRIEIDGRPPTVEQLSHPALVNYGHFTAMQVRGFATRGLALHLERLDAAGRELFSTGLDGDLVRHRIRHALGDDTPDASVRVVVHRPDDDAAPSVMVVVRPPVPAPERPVGLKSVPYQRPVAHIKHVGGFGQIHYGTLARREGFDDALLTGPGGVISECGIANVAFFDGSRVIWPDAPCLHGITMRLLEPLLTAAGLPSHRAPVRLADLPSFRSAMVTNSHGVAPVDRVDDLALPVDAAFAAAVREIYESVPLDVI